MCETQLLYIYDIVVKRHLKHVITEITFNFTHHTELYNLLQSIPVLTFKD